MKVESMIGKFLGLAAGMLLILAPAATRAADPGGSGSTPVKLENVPGSPVPRIILSKRAAERLGIETEKVGDEVVVRRQMVSGVIIPPLEKLPMSDAASGGFGGFGGFGQAAPAPKKSAKIPPSPPGSVWVQMAI